MKLPKTLLWIGALLTASSAIRCGGETGEPSGAGSGGSAVPPSDAAPEHAGQGGDLDTEAGSSGGSAPEGGSGGFAAEGGTGGIGGNWGGGGSAGGGNFPFEGGSPSPRDGGYRDGGPHEHEHEAEGGFFKDGSTGCPESLPSSTDPCWFPYPTSCPYTGQLCTCYASRNEPAYWTCFSAPVTPDASTCPASAPHDHEPCTLQGLSCAYGMRQLQCFCGGTRREGGAADGAEWNCW